MSNETETGLKAAIAAAPSDPMPRLALADWYMENDQDARGELLKLTTVLIRDRVPMDDPRWQPQRALQQHFDEEIKAVRLERLGESICNFLDHNPKPVIYDGINIRGLHSGSELMYIGGNLRSLPDNLYIGGALSLKYTPIQCLPENLYVGGWLELPYTQIHSLPETLEVSGDILFSHSQISREEAQRMITLPGLSDKAKRSGLESLGYNDMLPLLDAPGSRMTGETQLAQSGGANLSA